MDLKNVPVEDLKAMADLSDQDWAEIDSGKMDKIPKSILSAAVPQAQETQEPQDWKDQTFRAGGLTLASIGKALDVFRGTTTGPALAAALEGLTGKDVFRASEVGGALNPTTLEMYPSASELYKRAGVPEGAKLSDYLPFAEAGSGGWAPEKGGMLDWTVRGTGGFATDVGIDPLTYLSFGATAAAKTAAEQTVARQLAEQLARQTTKGKVIGALKDATSVATALPEAAANQVTKVPGAATALKVANAPSTALEGLGKYFYNLPLAKVEYEGRRFGKKEVGKKLYDLGIKSPFNLATDQIQPKISALTKKAKEINKAATKLGAEVDMNKAMAPAQEYVDSLKKIANPEREQQAAIKMMQRRINAYKKTAAKEPEAILRELPVQADFTGPYTEIAGYVPKQEFIGSLPVQAEFRPAYTEIKGWEPLQEKLIDLPVQADYKPPYRELPPQKGGLPIGTQEPVSMKLAEWTREQVQKAKKPNYYIKGDAPFNYDEVVKMGQLQPEQFVTKKPEIGYVSEPGKAIPGKTFEESYVARPPETIYWEEPGRAIPGKQIAEQYFPKKPVTVLDQTERIPGPAPLITEKWKTRFQEGVDRKGGWDQLAKTQKGQDFEKKMQYGLRKEAINAIDDASKKVEKLTGDVKGQDAARVYADLNDTAGTLLSTRKAMFGVEKEADRLKGGITGLTAALAALRGPKAAAINIGLNLGRTGLMGTGYYLRKAAENRLISPAMDTYLRRKYVDYYSPWSQMNEEK